MQNVKNDQTTQKSTSQTPSLAKTFGEKQGKDMQKVSPHKLELDHTRCMSMTGVKDVPVFTDKNITVKLSGETLVVTGQNLSVKTLDVQDGKLVVEGQVFSLKYTNSTSPSSFAKKLFR